VHQVALQVFKHGSEFQISLERVVAFGHRNGLEVGRKRADFSDFFWRPDEEKIVGVFYIRVFEATERSDDVASIGADAKLGHAPDVNGNLHGRI
jgi:hypothetical protein